MSLNGISADDLLGGDRRFFPKTDLRSTDRDCTLGRFVSRDAERSILCHPSCVPGCATMQQSLVTRRDPPFSRANGKSPTTCTDFAHLHAGTRLAQATTGVRVLDTDSLLFSATTRAPPNRPSSRLRQRITAYRAEVPDEELPPARAICARYSCVRSSSSR